MSDNTTTLVGNVTRDPELRFTQGGRAVASFGIAVNRRYQQNGEWQEQVSFFDVTAWGTLGENVAASISKGSRVIVNGRLEQRSWEDNEGGKKSRIEVVADAIGPDLRWAKCEIERTERSDANQSSGSSGGRTAPVGEEPFIAPASIGEF